MISIRGYHGKLSKDTVEELEKIGTTWHGNGLWTFSGTMSEFVDKWNDKCLLYPVCGTSNWVCYITDKPNFNNC